MANTKRVLLTGAGFTHNFGTPLASSMWSIIFNNPEIQRDNNLRDLLVNDEYFDYENIFYVVINDDLYSKENKKAINSAIKKAYLHVDDIVRNCSNSTASQAEEHIIKSFKGSYIFTLNQDLFLERQLHKSPDTTFVFPGAYTKILQENNNNKQFNEDVDIVTIENKEFTKWNNGRDSEINYIKLHGSFDWRDEQDKSLMVIGRDKENQLERHPLLRSYVNKFNKVLNEKNIKILIIGYGFNDKHINKALAEASNLDIYIIDPTDPKKWFDRIKNRDKVVFGNDIISKIRGYFPTTLSTIFPDNNYLENNTVQWQAIKLAFFD